MYSIPYPGLRSTSFIGIAGLSKPHHLAMGLCYPENRQLCFQQLLVGALSFLVLCVGTRKKSRPVPAVSAPLRIGYPVKDQRGGQPTVALGRHAERVVGLQKEFVESLRGVAPIPAFLASCWCLKLTAAAAEGLLAGHLRSGFGL